MITIKFIENTFLIDISDFFAKKNIRKMITMCL